MRPPERGVHRSIDCAAPSKVQAEGHPAVQLLKQASTATERALTDGLERFLESRNPASVDDAAITVYMVPEGDARDLRGQALARAAMDLPRNHILGLYTGYLEEANDRSPNTLDAIRHEPRYHYQFTSKAQANRHGNLIINPLPDAGNKLIAINDDGTSEANVQFVEFLHYGWPTVCMATLRAIAKDEELLVDYGPDYWRVHRILEKHIWAPLDKLQLQRKREGQRLLEKIELERKRRLEAEAQLSRLEKRARKQPAL